MPGAKARISSASARWPTLSAGKAPARPTARMLEAESCAAEQLVEVVVQLVEIGEPAAGGLQHGRIHGGLQRRWEEGAARPCRRIRNGGAGFKACAASAARGSASASGNTPCPRVATHPRGTPWPPAPARPLHPPSPARAGTARDAIGTVLSTFSGPSTAALSRRDVAALDTEAARRLATQKIGAQAAAAAMPANPIKAGEIGLEAGHAPPEGQPVDPLDPIDTRQHRHRGHRVAQARQRRAALGLQPRQRVARPRPRRFGRPPAHDQHGRGHQRQPELAQGGAARAGADGRLHPAREDHPLRPRAHSRARRPRARLGGARLLRVLPAARADHARGAVRRRRQAHAGVRALLDRRRRARLDRPRARRARLRRQVLHRRGQLGHRRQQHPGLLHPGRDEVPRPHPRRQARAAQRDAAGGVGARHLLGLRLADARIDAHADVGDVGPRHSAQLPHDAGLRRAHLPARQRRRRVALLQVPLGAGRGHALGGLGRGREDQRRRSGLPSARPLGSDRGGRVPGMGARPAGLHRGGGRPLQLRHPRRHQARSPRSWCRCARSGA